MRLVLVFARVCKLLRLELNSCCAIWIRNKFKHVIVQFINCIWCNDDSSDHSLLGRVVIGYLCRVFLLLTWKKGDFSKSVSVRQLGIYPTLHKFNYITSISGYRKCCTLGRVFPNTCAFQQQEWIAGLMSQIPNLLGPTVPQGSLLPG